MDPMNLQQNNVVHVNDFINLIRGENEDPIYNFGSDLLNDCFIDKQFVSLAGNSIFDQNNNVVNAYDPNSTLSSFSYFGGKVKGEGEGEDENDGIYSSSKTTTTTIIAGESTKAKSRMKTDRSKTLITERRRRGQMKEKLYSLRSLVPNITKMDKASIIGDAVEYVHRLQAQANKLKAEIAGLETSTLVYESYQGSSSIIDDPLNILVTNNSHPISKMIMQIKMYQVEEKGYHGKIACNKGQGVAASLYKALESLAGFKVQNSNLVTVCDSLILTFTLNVKGCDPEINLPNLKLWVTGALLNQGFEFMAFAHDA
ncbi:PREDICTED: transcription factor FER-LIKE IRON DEFICIENCY-INDUCED TRANSCRIPTION FACTOR-like isoform X2 [Lupinus angustifolius]|uniref:transcription factor FER-LIKE IRON DEFICIENCY-INDUCED TRANSCRIPTION FACTOR-like isoform X1 n=1 Tax=Lupinus angustifolius TaxID=3871 RepID=UPI00092ED859|nr:PREDICTED: transcription factor FER-LIKE IRON DEFICIENCY-INDUCED TRANSCRIPTION FACTOR-like isoform X1 [Lupinus angustifolius]XP_019457386.1 PREDICTED: transcription factor FER-LIKE IRON DEFICIENCY-INDUCED TRANSCRIPTION FACTOR-like isoform X2 [Lupinus angustifolius]